MESALQVPPFNGRFRLLNPDGSEAEASDARLELETEALVVHPRSEGPLRVEFCDVDGLEPGDYLTQLTLASGDRVELSMLGRRFGEFSDGLGARLRSYQAKNLLLAEPSGGEQFACEVEQGGNRFKARVRVYTTRLAVLPEAATPFGVAFGELSGVEFDEDRYAIELTTASGRLALLQLGRQTRPCLELIRARLAELRQRSAAALGFLVPRLSSLPARKLAQALPDGVPARRELLDAISPGIWPDLVTGAIGSKDLKACFEVLAARCPAGEVAVAVKELQEREEGQTPEGAEASADEEGSPPEPDDEAEEQVEPEEAPESGEPNPMAGRIVWFAFPILAPDRSIPGNAVAVEVVSRGGRATYLFRIAPPALYREAPYEELLRLARERVRSVSQALVALGFKREPIYLTDDKLRTGRYARYRLALRLSAPLAASRTSFVGRAIHGPSWRGQLEAVLARAMV